MSKRLWIWRNRWRLLAGGLLLTFLALYTPPFYPLCGFRWLTGRPCPLCGLTRAFFALAKGHWAEAIRLHALSPLAAGVCIMMFARKTPRWLPVLVLFAVYGILRICRLVP